MELCAKDTLFAKIFQELNWLVICINTLRLFIPAWNKKKSYYPQIGSTEKTAYALADGILYVMGYNFDGRAGLGHNKRMIREPTAITIDGNR